MSIELSGQRRLVWNWANFLQEDTRPRVIDTRTGEPLCDLVGHTGYVRGGFELAGNRLVTWSNDLSIRVWSLADGECELVLEGHTKYVNQVSLLDEVRILSTSGDGTMRIWALDSGTELAVMTFPEDMAWAPHVVASGDRVLATGDGHYALFDASDGSLLVKNRFCDTSCDIDAVGAEHFLVRDQNNAIVLEASSGEIAASTDMPGYMAGHFVLEDAAVLIWGHDTGDSKVLGFELWRPLEDTSIKGPSIPGTEPVSFRVQGGEVLIACKDYRVLRLSLDMASLDDSVSLQPIPEGRFRSYRPAVGGGASDAVGGLAATLITFEEAESLRWEGANESQDLGVSNCWWSPDCIAFEDEFETDDGTVHEWNLESDTRRTVPARDYFDQNPSVASLREEQRLRAGDRRTLADWFGRRHGIAAASVMAALESLFDPKAGARPVARTTLDGRLLAWCSRSGSIHVLDVAPGSDEVSIIDCSGHGELVGIEPLLAPDGQVHLWRDKRFAPLVVNERPVTLSPIERDSLIGARWCRGDRVVVRRRSRVEVFDARSGDSIALLDGGHGLSNWGFAELANGTLVTWSRSALRSWDPESYAPMVELVDPVDWGPGYAQVISTRARGLLFTVGHYSLDSRIVHWDGAENVSVYIGHSREVSGLVEGPDGRFLSWERDGRGDMLVWRMRDPE